MLKEFTASPWRALDMWGGGHTVQTDPTRQGWVKIVYARQGYSVIFVGRPGKPGCFTAVQASGNEIDVGLYEETFEEVKALLDAKSRSLPDCPFKRYSDIPGWGLSAIWDVQDVGRHPDEDEPVYGRDWYYES